MSVLQRYGRGLAIGMPAGAAALTTVGAWRISRRFINPDPVHDRYVTPWELDIPYEDVSFRTPDGLTLRGWWLPREAAGRTVITLTGHRGVRADTIGIAAALWRRGANLLLFDYRGRGDSDPSVNTLGYLETTDTLAAVEYALGRSGHGTLGLVGYSMGGSVAILAAARDRRIGAVVADSPFASQRKVIRQHFRRRTKLPALPMAQLMELFLPYDVEQVEPIREVGHISPRGLMLIQGSHDRVTDPHDSQALYEAAGEPREMWALPSVAHCGAYFVDRSLYAEKVGAFLRRHLR
ncbi:MAG: alpha/beta hydrolase [Chloroflexota bacterium]|nr:alpha/beta hydrolase [Chloroflexota bacterium]